MKSCLLDFVAQILRVRMEGCGLIYWLPPGWKREDARVMENELAKCDTKTNKLGSGLYAFLSGLPKCVLSCPRRAQDLPRRCPSQHDVDKVARTNNEFMTRLRCGATFATGLLLY